MVACKKVPSNIVVSSINTIQVTNLAIITHNLLPIDANQAIVTLIFFIYCGQNVKDDLILYDKRLYNFFFKCKKHLEFLFN